MGMFKSIGKVFKSVGKVVKKAAGAPFEMVRDTWRGVERLGQGVGELAQGDVEGAFKSAVGGVASAGKGLLTGASLGAVSDNGYLIDTKVKQASEDAMTSASVSEDASVSFAEAGTPSVVVGADEVEEDVLKRKKSSRQAGFLGGVESGGSSILIG